MNLITKRRIGSYPTIDYSYYKCKIMHCNSLITCNPTLVKNKLSSLRYIIAI